MIKKILLGLLALIVLAGIILYTPDISIEEMKSRYADDVQYGLLLGGEQASSEEE